MKLRGQRPSEFSLQNNAVNPSDIEESIAEEDDPRKCPMEDAKTKFGTFIFGILLMAAGTALLYFGFRPNPEVPKSKSSSDNKILLTCGFVSTLLGLFCFVVSILMFKNVSCLYSENIYPIDDDVNT